MSECPGMAGAAEIAQRTFTLAGLRAASCQTQGLLRLPSPLQAAIAAFIGDIPMREVKQSVARLTSNMKARKEAAVVSAGALAVEGSDDARAAVDEYLGKTTATQVRLSKELFAPAQAPVKYEYDDKNVAAYVAARMPAVYGAVHRVLSEVSTRLPDFSPSRVLDFGSGPGTVLWALREIWPLAVEHVNLIEPSRAMATACRSLLLDVENLPLIKVHPSLSLFSRGLRKPTPLHDLVISSYALGELLTTAERITAVRQLWALTTDVLVLIEPGTPQGSSIVREMRAHILHMEKKKLRRSADGGESRDTEARGAFVVAPCPHDGRCPMDNTNDWCHFIQRLERTTSQRVSKRHTKPTPLRAYEDEKFSFVVLRRGSRPSVPYPLQGLTFEPRERGEEIEFIEDPMSKLNGTHEESELEEAELEDDEESELEYDEVVIGNKVADVGSGWARIVRTPIRRGRRTILDLCAATEEDGSRGAVTRVVCSRRGHAAALHPQARKSRWGDLWPC